MNKDCECLGAGLCMRHKVEKNQREWELCSGTNCQEKHHLQYWNAWENCTMPRQVCEGDPPNKVKQEKKLKKKTGLGDKVETLIKTVTGGKAKGCSGCQKRKAWLNNLIPGSYEKPPAKMPFIGEPIRNLIYHIYPSNTYVWRYNVDRLLQRVSQFNGKRIVAISYDSTTDCPDSIKRYMGDSFEYIVRENDPELGESANFFNLLSRVESTHPDEITFYAHAKGVTHPARGTDSGWDSVRLWADASYEINLDYPHLVDMHLQKKPMTGSFKVEAKAFPDIKGYMGHHYSGTFFWFRNLDLFGVRNWAYVPQAYHGVEAWPGLIYAFNDTASLFTVENIQHGKLYQRKVWDTKVTRRLENWKELNQCHFRDWTKPSNTTKS